MSRQSAIKKFGWITRVLALLVAVLMLGSLSAYAWNYRYDSVYDVGIWTNNSIDRFRYWYGVTAWEQYSQWGGWQMVGNYGWSPVARGQTNPANFIGDGAYRNLANGWEFAYSATGNYNAWARTAEGIVRFSYAYSTGQWNNVYTATNTWAVLGVAGMSSAFIGDGTYRNVGNGWIFGYWAGGDAGYWKRAADGVMRFAYSYVAGRWSDVYTTTNSWAVLSASGIGPAFIGNGAYRNVGNGWLFAYSATEDTSYWTYWAYYDPTIGLNYQMFKYNYGADLWYDQGAYGGWQVLGRAYDAGRRVGFVGDGASHGLENGFLYKHYPLQGNPTDTLRDAGVWSDNKGCMLAYDYLNGKWYDYSQWNLAQLGYYWNPLTDSQTSAAFIADGAWHPHSIYGGGRGIYFTTGNGPHKRFDTFPDYPWEQWSYDYSTGTWDAWRVSGSSLTWYQTLAGPGAPSYTTLDHVVPQ